MINGIVFNVQRFSTDDGPGIRTTVFLKGCSDACAWCHDPESIRRQPEIQAFPDRCSRIVTLEQPLGSHQ